MYRLSRTSLHVFVLLGCLCLTATSVLAVTVPAKLAAARFSAEQGQRSAAMSTYKEYIAAHPMMQSVFDTRGERLPPSRAHDLLLAFSELTELQRAAGNERERERYLDRLEWLQRNRSISAINRYHLGRIYLDNGRLDQGVETLEKIASDQERVPKSEHNKVYLRTCAKLLDTHVERGRPDLAQTVVARMHRSLGLFDYDLRDRYKIARLLNEYDSRRKAEPLLAKIAAVSDPTVLSVEEYTIVQASIKLIGIYADRRDNTALDRLLDELLEKFADRPMTSRNRYLLALAIDRAGRSVTAKDLLAKSP